MARCDAAPVVLIVGGSPEPAGAETLRRAAAGCIAVVAIDRGLDALRDAGLACDVFCGDADSVGAAGAAEVRAAEAGAASDAFEVVRYNPHKDDTDLGLALTEIAGRWPGARLRGTCLSGGAPDHALAVLGRLSAWSGAVEVVEDGFTLRILKAGESWELGAHLHERFSFIPLTPSAEVSERGLRWELEHKMVPLLSDLGISNVVDTPSSRIVCHQGTIAAWAFTGFFAGA